MKRKKFTVQLIFFFGGGELEALIIWVFVFKKAGGGWGLIHVNIFFGKSKNKNLKIEIFKLIIKNRFFVSVLNHGNYFFLREKSIVDVGAGREEITFLALLNLSQVTVGPLKQNQMCTHFLNTYFIKVYI